jgi:hypothetical protein
MASGPDLSHPHQTAPHAHDDHGHAHGLPHSHGGPVRVVASAASSTSGTAMSVGLPGISLLRLSIAARVVMGVALSAVIWAAIHWATL